MADTKYTGHDVLTYIDDVEYLANIQVTKTRDVINVPSGNLIGKMKEDGQLDVTGTMTLTYRKGALSAKATGGSVVSGTAAVLKTATVIAADTVVAPTSTDSKSAICSATLGTSAVTTAGKLIFYGTDPADNPISDIVDVPTTLAVGAAVYTKKVFKTVTHIAVVDIASTGNGTFAYDSVAGAASATPGRASTWTLRVEGVKSDTGKYCKLTMPGCFATKESFESADTNAYIGQPIEFSMKDVNQFSETYLD
jgi:hypothetical protein